MNPLTDFLASGVGLVQIATDNQADMSENRPLVTQLVPKNSSHPEIRRCLRELCNYMLLELDHFEANKREAT